MPDFSNVYIFRAGGTVFLGFKGIDSPTKHEYYYIQKADGFRHIFPELSVEWSHKTEVKGV